MTNREVAWVGEVMRDAADKPDRLSPWERNFVANVTRMHSRQGDDLSLSSVQVDTIKQLEKKVYA